MNPPVVVFIPAHNEQDNIIRAINSLKDQTVHTDIIVVCDNCTDNTVHVAKQSGARVFCTVNNKHKKAGALNQAFSEYADKYDYIFCMDADTCVESNIIECGLVEFANDPNLGAVCSRAGVLKQTNLTFWKRVLWHFQNVEYGDFDASRIERNQKIKVIHGMAAMYNKNALFDVLQYRYRKWNSKHVYDVSNITEDYELTICLRELGYHVSSSMDMIAWTVVPLSLSELWIQRVRWLRGGIDALRKHGINPATKWEFVNAGLFWIMLTLHFILIYGIIQWFVSYGVSFPYTITTTIVFGAIYLDGIYRLKFVQNRTWMDIVIRIAFIPAIVYTWLCMSQQVYAYFSSFGKFDTRW